MASYKVIFRDEYPEWQPGCPIQVETVQVSRNTETAQCYLQLKIRNVSDSKISRTTLKAVMESPDGKAHEQIIELLDADLEPGSELSPKAAEIPLKDASTVQIAVAEADGASVWASLAAVPKAAELHLGEKAAAERAELAREAKVHNHVAKHEEFDNWWLCSCGAVNVARSCCHACKAPLGDLSNWETESWLEEAANRRAYDAARKKLASKNVKSVEEAKQGFLALGEYGDSPTQVAACEEKLRRLAADAKKRNKVIGIAIGAVAAVVIVVAIVVNLLIPMMKYSDAQKLSDSGEYYAAYQVFSALDGFFDSTDKMQSLIKDHPEAFIFVKTKEVYYSMYYSKFYYTRTYELSADGLIQTVTTDYDGSSLNDETKSYTYDASGMLTGYTIGSTKYTSTATTDGQGRLASLTSKGNDGYTLTVEYEYASDGSVSKTTSTSKDSTVTKTYENGFRTSYVYKHKNPNESKYDGNFKYTVDSRNALGNPTHITCSDTSTSGTSYYFYTFEYDEYGNITKQYEDGKLIYEYEWTLVPEPADYAKLLASLKF